MRLILYIGNGISLNHLENLEVSFRIMLHETAVSMYYTSTKTSSQLSLMQH